MARWLALFLPLLLFAGLFPGSARSLGPPPLDHGDKTVLILHAHEAAAPVFTGTDRGLQAALQAGGVPIFNQIFESLELRRYPIPEHRRLLVEQMRLRHGGRRIDAIVTMFPEALEFVLADCRGILPEAPLLAMYLPDGFELPPSGRPIVSHSAAMDIAGTLQAALTLLPGTRRVWVVSGRHSVDRAIADQARRDLKRWESVIEFRYLSAVPFEDLLKEVASAPPDAIVLFLTLINDVQGENYSTFGVAQSLSRASAVPVFGIVESAFDSGIVGGSLLSFEKVGRQAAEMVLGILKRSVAPDGLPPRLDVEFVPAFDWRAIARFGLDAGRLPAGSVVINRPFSLWGFKYHVLGAGVFLLAQTVLILFLLAQKRRRNSAEESLRQRTQEVDRFFRVTPDLLCIAKTDGAFLRLNPAWEKVLGYSREEILARTFYSFVHPDDLESTREAAGRLAAQQDLIHFQNRYRCKDGSYRVLEWSASPAGDIVFAAARDITERLEEEVEARQRRDEFAHLARVATMGELTASLAHEINQPLSAIMSNAQAARRYLDAPGPDLEEVKEILDDIVKEDARAGKVINRLRALLKKSKTELEPVDLNRVFREMADLLKSDAVIRGVTVFLELAPTLPPVRGDRIQLQQVALNLMLNAFDAVSGGLQERRIVLRTALEGDMILASVSDNGSGIAPGDSERIFEPFYSSKPHGLGMGLSISRSIIIRHGGRMWAQSNADGGATFCFTLPASGNTSA